MSEWISVDERLPEETQAYGCTTDSVYVKNANSGFEGKAFMVRSVRGNRWYTHTGSFELCSVTHWRQE